MKKRTTIYLDDRLILLAGEKGLLNISDFCRLCLEEFILNGKNIGDPIADAAHEASQRIIQQMQEQKTIVKEEVPPPEEKRIRCYDKEAEAYDMIPVSEIEKHPTWYTVDELSAPYEVQP